MLVKLGHTVHNEYVIIMQSGIWKTLLVFRNDMCLVAVLVIQPGAKMIMVDEFLNHLVIDKAALPVGLPVCIVCKQNAKSVN